eukprot:1157588-Pelagomonas_calceolata.AAC.2
MRVGAAGTAAVRGGGQSDADEREQWAGGAGRVAVWVGGRGGASDQAWQLPNCSWRCVAWRAGRTRCTAAGAR